MAQAQALVMDPAQAMDPVMDLAMDLALALDLMLTLLTTTHPSDVARAVK